MDAVKIFNAELCSLYELKPPITKAKMSQITKTAIKAIKFYKHIVQSIEKFIQKCRTEYKVPGLYIVDSIIRQSRKQFGSEKDMFAVRFSKNIVIMFNNLFDCPQEDIAKMIRVLNLWQKNGVYGPEIIQPLLDLAADPHNEELFESVQQKVEKVTGMVPSMPLKSDQKPPALTADALKLGFDPKNMDNSVAGTAVNNADMANILTQIIQTFTCPPIIPSISTIGSQPQQLQLMQQALMQYSSSLGTPSTSLTQANSTPTLSNIVAFPQASFPGQNMAPFDGGLLSQLQLITQQLLASSNYIISKSTNQPSTSSPNETNTDVDASNSEDRRISSLDRRLDAIKAGRESDFCYDEEDVESGMLDSSKNDEFEKMSLIDHKITVTVRNTSPAQLSDGHHSSCHSSPHRNASHSSRHDYMNKSAAYNDASPISGDSENSQENGGYEAEEGEVIDHNNDFHRHSYEKSKKNSLRGPHLNDNDATHSPEYFWTEKAVSKGAEQRKRKYSGEELEWETKKSVSSKKVKPNYENSFEKLKDHVKSSAHYSKQSKYDDLKKNKYYNGKTQKSCSRSYESDESNSDPMYDPFKHKEIRSVVSRTITKKTTNKTQSSSNHKDESKLRKYKSDLTKDGGGGSSVSIDPKLKSVCSKMFDEKLDRYAKVDKVSKDVDLKVKLKDTKLLENKNRETVEKLSNYANKEAAASTNKVKEPKTNNNKKHSNDVSKKNLKMDAVREVQSNKIVEAEKKERERSRSKENMKSSEKKRNYRTNAKLRKSPKAVIVIEASPDRSENSSVEFVTDAIVAPKPQRNPNLPPLKAQHTSICSTTLWIGRINKVVSEEEIKSTLNKYTITSINIVPPRGCAFVTFASRIDACEALEFLKDAALLGSPSLKVAWAAGNGIKTSEFFCHVEHGVTYVPWDRLKNVKLRDLLEGGVLDEETLPPGYNMDEENSTKENVTEMPLSECNEINMIPIPAIPVIALPVPTLPVVTLPIPIEAPPPVEPVSPAVMATLR